MIPAFSPSPPAPPRLELRQSNARVEAGERRPGRVRKRAASAGEQERPERFRIQWMEKGGKRKRKLEGRLTNSGMKSRSGKEVKILPPVGRMSPEVVLLMTTTEGGTATVNGR